MKIFGIIAEFNPLHNGHSYLIEKARESGADFVVAVLSGALVQRGEFSYISKWARAKAAICCGVDLVVELPAIYSCAAAPYFAAGAIEILHKLGAVDSIVFGSESADLSLLEMAADAQNSNSGSESVRALLDGGASYAKAIGSSLNLPPNDILASSYLAALKKQNSSIGKIPIKRLAVMHDSDKQTDNFASASNIRNICEDNLDFANFLPSSSSKILQSEVNAGRTIDKKALFTAVTAAVLTKTPLELSEILDVSEGIEYRIIDACKYATDYDDLILKIKTKRYTLSRIRRILLYILIGIKKGVYQSEQCGAHILAIGKGGNEVLSACSKSFTLTSSAKQLEEIDSNYRYESIACDLSSLLYKTPTPRSQNYTNQIVKPTNN